LNIFIHDYGGYPFTRQLAKALAARNYRVVYAFSESTQYLQHGGAAGASKNPTEIGIRLNQPFYK